MMKPVTYRPTRKPSRNHYPYGLFYQAWADFPKIKPSIQVLRYIARYFYSNTVARWPFIAVFHDLSSGVAGQTYLL